MPFPAPLTALGLLLVVLPGVTGAQTPAKTPPPLPADTLAADLLSRPIPFGLPEPVRADGQANATRLAQRFKLGRRLFFDPILSADRGVACASCHDPRHGFSSREALPIGVHGRRAARNAPTLFNRAYGKSHSWDGASPNLRHQVLRPIENEREMGLPLDKALARLRDQKEYRGMFAAAYGDKAIAKDAVTRKQLADALAAFVGRLYLADSPVDRLRSAGDRTALTRSERAGLWIYESKGRCWQCHAGPNFTDEQFHNTGIGAVRGRPEPGRMAVTSVESDRGRFKTPTLRGLAFTAPYMHDGSLGTLKEVVEFYRRGGRPNPNLDRRIQPLGLTDDDARNLVAFLGALSKRALPRVK